MSARYEKPEAGVIQQSSILRDVELPYVYSTEDGQAAVRVDPYPWLVVLNQDCDLLLDRLARLGQPIQEGKPPVKRDKVLRSVLLCPAFRLDHVLAGIYIEDASAWGSTRKNILLQNREDRLHVLTAEESFLPEDIVLDFKLIVSADPDYLYQWARQNPDKIVARLASPFQERLMQRFVNYFGRIAEPDE